MAHIMEYLYSGRECPKKDRILLLLARLKPISFILISRPIGLLRYKEIRPRLNTDSLGVNYRQGAR